MTTRSERDRISRFRRSLTDFFRSVKPQPSASQEEECPSSNLPDSQHTSSKRKASASAPSSPLSYRFKRKRPVLTLPSSPSPTSAKAVEPTSTPSGPLLFPPPSSTPPSSVSRETVVLPPTPSHFTQTFDEESDSSLGSRSDRSRSVSSESINSLASSGSPWVSGPRERRQDVADAKRVLKTIEELKSGTYAVKKGGPGGKYLIERTLHYRGYQKLWEELRKEAHKELLKYVEKEWFRFDYIPRPCKGSKQFVIHMPSVFHEGMVGGFNTEIVKWLSDIQTGTLCTVQSTKDETMKAATKIRPVTAATVRRAGPHGGRMEPDLSFVYEGCTIADLVVEVAWSQRKLKLPERAKRFIDLKKGRIRTVVGLNMIDIYRGGRGATFSVWRAQHVGNNWIRTAVVENQSFLDENGQAVKDCSLHLSLKDFICEEQEHLQKPFEDVPLEIPSTKLYDLYRQAFIVHVLGKAEEEMDEVLENADAAVKEMLRAKKMIQEQKVKDPRNRTVMEKKDLAEVWRVISKVEDNVNKMKHTIGGVEEKMKKVDEKLEIVERKKVEVEKRVAEFETEMAEMREEAEKMVEAEEANEEESSEPEHITSEKSVAEAPESGTPRATQPPPSSPRTPEKSRRYRLRSMRLTPKR
ncbi:hypothetical protein Z517_03302 [Fonsecaea pedrosoi CBS 271.37]|uniref:Uncharacterized protein n=1 Tax=Fonsecaea pedrosoi CBS 271.37 TaxID=1442368 RepID=A0A0D2E205_9EURO|nr:uncharacterized protein Z517_03302 [Fonsecaea pedrosoi CBS 271.37]KIW84056.1 hypothetical protein Z517_03302 [Fonsecaea pedrosoi CBS 271.37]